MKGQCRKMDAEVVTYVRGWGEALTRMKRPWLANFWWSGIVENTDNTKQLNTSRKLKHTSSQKNKNTPGFQ